MQEASNHAHIRIVQSRQNARVKELRVALKKSIKTASGLVAIEGSHLVQEALRSGLRVETVFIRSGSLQLLDTLEMGGDAEILELSPDVFASAMTTEAPQGIAALVKAPEFSLSDALRGKSTLVVVAAGLQDPGNLGTIVRSAEAFGASGVVALPGTVSVWNAKALRASSGSAFRLPVVNIDVRRLMEALEQQGIRSLATVVDGGVAAPDIDLRGPVALFIGNEGSGLSAELASACKERVTIPCPGPVESLNAAIAASVLLYEASRQRKQI